MPALDIPHPRWGGILYKEIIIRTFRTVSEEYSLKRLYKFNFISQFFADSTIYLSASRKPSQTSPTAAHPRRRPAFPFAMRRQPTRRTGPWATMWRSSLPAVFSYPITTTVWAAPFSASTRPILARLASTIPARLRLSPSALRTRAIRLQIARSSHPWVLKSVSPSPLSTSRGRNVS